MTSSAYCGVIFRRYHEIRPHWELIRESGGDPLTLADVYVGHQAVRLPLLQGRTQIAGTMLEQMIDGAHIPVSVAEEDA